MIEARDRLSRIFYPASGFAVAALALIGLVKARPIRDALPVDATLLAAAMCLVLCLVAVVVRRHLPVETLWVGLVTVAMLPGLLWATDPNNTYADKKVHELLTLVPACLLAPLILLVTTRGRTWFLIFVGATAVIPAFIVLTTPVDPVYGRATVSDLNPVGIGRVLAAGAVIAAVCALRADHRWFRIGCALGSIVLLAGVWRTGSRGPLLAVLLALAFVTLFDLAGRASRRVVLVSVAGAGLAVVAFVLLVVFNEGSLLQRDPSQSNSERSALYGQSLKLLALHPAGIGWGNLVDHLAPDQVVPNQGWAQYSHNMLLEVGVEGGWIALAALLGLIAVSFRRLLTRRETLDGAALLGLWVFAFVVAMTSSDFTGNRLTLVMIGVGLLRPINGPSRAEPPRAGLKRITAFVTERPARTLTDTAP